MSDEAGMTKGDINRLGERLRAAEKPSPDDLRQLQEVRDLYRINAREPIAAVLGVMGLEPTSREKSNATLIDKLKREHFKLSEIQDVAGCRIVVGPSRIEQDRVANAIAERFDSVKVRDRRANPSHGYRAVHLIIKYATYPVEIQVRTEMQHQWAEIVEDLADKWGRQMRYGAGPADPDRPMAAGSSITRREVWESLEMISEIVDLVEQIEHNIEVRASHIKRRMAPWPWWSWLYPVRIGVALSMRHMQWSRGRELRGYRVELAEALEAIASIDP